MSTTPTPTPSPVVRDQRNAQRRWFYGGGLHTWLATAADTDGAFLLFEISTDHGKTTPLHSHPDSAETMYVLEGEILMHMDGREERIGAGGLAFAPRGTPHAFLVLSPAARLLCLHTPGCCQAFYWDASEPADAEHPRGTVDFGRIRESAQRNSGIELLGPPPFAV